MDSHDTYIQKLHDIIERHVDHITYSYDNNNIERVLITLDIRRYTTLRNEIKNISCNIIDDNNINKYIKRISMENGVLVAVILTDDIYRAITNK